MGKAHHHGADTVQGFPESEMTQTDAWPFRQTFPGGKRAGTGDEGDMISKLNKTAGTKDPGRAATRNDNFFMAFRCYDPLPVLLLT